MNDRSPEGDMLGGYGWYQEKTNTTAMLYGKCTSFVYKLQECQMYYHLLEIRDISPG